MSDERGEPGGRLTTTIARPKHRRASDAGRSRLGDIRRRRVPRADRIAPRRRSAWLFGLAALTIAGAIGSALFVLPVRTWFEQDRQLGGLEHELSELQTVNDDLESEVDRLQTDVGIVQAAREELGLIEPGDNRETMQPLPPLPRDLPAGWPYAQVGQILAIREAKAAAGPALGEADADDDGGWAGPQMPPVAPDPTLTATTVTTSVTAATSAATAPAVTTAPAPAPAPTATTAPVPTATAASSVDGGG